jgi:hypothetical protein
MLDTRWQALWAAGHFNTLLLRFLSVKFPQGSLPVDSG